MTYEQKFNSKVWDRVFGHPIGEEPRGGIEPQVFANWYAMKEAEKERAKQQKRAAEAEERERKKAYRQAQAAQIRMAKADKIPYGGMVCRADDGHMAVVESGGMRYEHRDTLVECYKWLLNECRKLGLTEQLPLPPMCLPKEVIGYVLSCKGQQVRLIARNAGIGERKVREILQKNGDIYGFRHYDYQRKREITAMALKTDYADMTVPQLQTKYDISKDMICKMAKELGVQKSETYKERVKVVRYSNLINKAVPNANKNRKRLWDDERRRVSLGLPQQTKFRLSKIPRPTSKAIHRLCRMCGYTKTSDPLTLKRPNGKRCSEHLFTEKYNLKFID